MLWLAALLTRASALVIEDFDDGSVVLGSFPGEDVHPDSWCLDSVTTYNNSPFSLRLHGNTWKVETITPVTIDSGSVWQVAAYVEERGEVQGFGLADSAHVLLYAFAGTELLDPDRWVTVYQGAFAEDTWNLYPLPVGEDWLQRFGYLPNIRTIVFINDRDADPRASGCFDLIEDITNQLPVPPQVEVWYENEGAVGNRDGSWDVTVQFHSRVTDPDSREHWFSWFFGDGGTSRDSAPEHVYTVRDNHDYTVLLQVRDSTERWGRATCRVTVDPGPTTFPVRLNFVGDVMLARGYENPGGIIDTIGPEGIFAPTRALLAAADVTVANLESPLTDRGTRHPTKPIVFRGRPANVAGLVYAGIDVVSLANNHVIDYGLEGLRQTQQVLDVAGIGFSGAGADINEAARPLFCQKSGVNFAFIACCDRNGQYDNYQPFFDAGLNKPGFAYLDSFHVRRAIEQVRDLADVVVVEMHTGEEYEPVPEDGNASGGDEMYSPLALFPAPNDTAERHRAVEAGADLVICHHPHVLQGFEVYQGKLIAHSLGNYAFDLGYPETYPSAVLNALVDERGFYNYTVVPVYIDDWIPRPAHGGLGRHILSYLAQRSRELGTWLVVVPDSTIGWIALDTAMLEPWVEWHCDSLALHEEGGFWVSEPLALPVAGCLSGVVSAAPPADWQFRVGRELIWFGGFEDEGATMWLLNDPDEFYDSVARQGTRSLCQVRTQNSGTILTNLEKRLPCSGSRSSHTVVASVRTENAESAAVEFRCYSARSGGSQLAGFSTGALRGTTDWTTCHASFTPVNQTAYFDVALRSRGPRTGIGRAWFDDVSVIEWGSWQSLAGPVQVSEPNDICWLQLRSDLPAQTATVGYEQTRYDAPVAVRHRPPDRALVQRPLVRPNPARTSAAIEFYVGALARVTVRIYDTAGREVRQLIASELERGPHVATWDCRDNAGLRVGAGAFFCCIETSRTRHTLKLVLAE